MVSDWRIPYTVISLMCSALITLQIKTPSSVIPVLSFGLCAADSLLCGPVMISDFTEWCCGFITGYKIKRSVSTFVFLKQYNSFNYYSYGGIVEEARLSSVCSCVSAMESSAD